MAKGLLLLLSIGILLSLLYAAIALIRQPAGSTSVVRALSVRMALSVGMFSILMWGWFAGWMHPHTLGSL